MALFSAGLPAELVGLLKSMDWSAVAADQRWVLRSLREDGPALVRLLWRMLGREQDVLDAYQDCYCRLLAQARDASEPPGRGYIFRTAMNVAQDHRRRRRVRQTHWPALAALRSQDTGEAPSPQEAAAQGDLVEALRLAMETLPQRLREVVALRDLAEMSYRDVARVLGLTVGTARVYRRQAIVALSELLKE